MVASLRFDKDRRLSLLAGMLLDELLCERGLRERDMAYVENDRGKPSGRPLAAASATSSTGLPIAGLPGSKRAMSPCAVTISSASRNGYDRTRTPSALTNAAAQGCAAMLDVANDAGNDGEFVPDTRDYNYRFRDRKQALAL